MRPRRKPDHTEICCAAATAGAVDWCLLCCPNLTANPPAAAPRAGFEADDDLHKGAADRSAHCVRDPETAAAAAMRLAPAQMWRCIFYPALLTTLKTLVPFVTEAAA